MIDCTVSLNRQDSMRVDFTISRLESRIRVELLCGSGVANIFMNVQQASDLLQQIGSTIERIKIEGSKWSGVIADDRGR
jgi:hypothetical protein